MELQQIAHAESDQSLLGAAPVALCLLAHHRAHQRAPQPLQCQRGSVPLRACLGCGSAQHAVQIQVDPTLQRQRHALVAPLCQRVQRPSVAAHRRAQAPPLVHMPRRGPILPRRRLATCQKRHAHLQSRARHLQSQRHRVRRSRLDSSQGVPPSRECRALMPPLLGGAARSWTSGSVVVRSQRRSAPDLRRQLRYGVVSPSWVVALRCSVSGG